MVAVARRRALTPGVLLVGLIVIAAARVAIPAAPPLYDGVVVVEPYRWVDPPPGESGGAQGASAAIPVAGGQSPLVAVATPEMEPQAQVFAVPGELTLPPGARDVKVSITPVPSEGVPTDGQLDGNVYRISVTDDKGRPLTAAADTHVSIVLRATDPHAVDATIARFADGTWQPLETSSQGVGGAFLAVVREFGDFAVITPGSGASPSTTAGAAGSAGPSSAGPAGASASAVPSATGVASVPPESFPAPGLASQPGAPPDWAVPAIVVAGVLLVGSYGWVRRRRRGRYPGAHRRR